MRGLVSVSAARLRISLLIGLAVTAATLLLLLNPQDAEAQPSGGAAGRDLTVDITNASAAPAIPTRANVAFVVTVSNIREGQASNVLVSVTIPSAFTALSGPECTFNGSTASCTTPSLGGNSQKTFRISGTAPSTISGTSQSFTLTAVADPDNTVAEGTGGNNNNSDNFTVNVVTRADLNVGIGGTGGQSATQQAAPDLVFVVTVDNDGDQAASNLLVRSTLPKDVAFVRVEENQLGTCLQNSTASNGALNVNCTLSSLPAGTNRHVRIIGKLIGSVPDGVQVTSAVNVDPNNTVPERNENDNTAFLITTMRAVSDVQLTGGVSSHSTRGRGPVLAGAQCLSGMAIRLDLVVKNNGPNASGSTRVATEWPAGIVSSESSTCFNSCDVPAVNPGQSVTIVMGGLVNVNLAAGTRITSTVDPAGTLFDAVVGNNRVTFTCN